MGWSFIAFWGPGTAPYRLFVPVARNVVIRDCDVRNGRIAYAVLSMLSGGGLRGTGENLYAKPRNAMTMSAEGSIVGPT